MTACEVLQRGGVNLVSDSTILIRLASGGVGLAVAQLVNEFDPLPFRIGKGQVRFRVDDDARTIVLLSEISPPEVKRLSESTALLTDEDREAAVSKPHRLWSKSTTGERISSTSNAK